MENHLQHLNCGSVKLSGGDALYDRHLTFDAVSAKDSITARERFEAAARSIRDLLSQRWIRTEETYNKKNAKRIYYLSMEFLIGRSLENNVTNMQIEGPFAKALAEHRIDVLELLEQEPDAGLGNGGLGRLAACFLDSMATLGYPGMGYGLRYDYGIFKQSLENGWQQESPDHWLDRDDPWEVARPNEIVKIPLNCAFSIRDGNLAIEEGQPSTLLGMPYDRPVVGYGARTVNTLRLWAARATTFDFHRFSGGDFAGALAQSLTAETVTRVLYPDDSTTQGKALRFLQEYFLVACSLADALRRFRANGNKWESLADKMAIQLNDTHPTLAVPELMRLLLDEAKLDWDKAWKLTRDTLAYTNHTLLPEALEKWPVAWFEKMIPRNLEIIYEINRRFLDDVRGEHAGDEEIVRRVSLIDDAKREVRMANVAIVGSHSTNGVAAIHSELLKRTVVPDLAAMFPERFSNKTNGVTQRRFLLVANPPLSRVITEAIGDGWITDLSKLSKLKKLSADGNFNKAVRKAKRDAKLRFVDWFQRAAGQELDPDSIFDCQIKRIHEYKRQLLNALHLVGLVRWLRENPKAPFAPRTFLFAGKAAPAYKLAKVIVKFINSVADTVARDPALNGKLKIVFVPDYCVSVAERLIPAADVSEQISTAGYEASGTSNMKFMMNGALTVGTRDGATIEMAAAAGEENFFLFGLTAEQVANSKDWYSPTWHYENEPETRATLDLVFGDHFNPDERGIFEPIRETLFANGDKYMHLADLTAYAETHKSVADLYAKPAKWTERAILNIAGSGGFSSDRTIEQYAREIWNAEKVPIAK
jgi:starch phosphorylase